MCQESFPCVYDRVGCLETLMARCPLDLARPSQSSDGTGVGVAKSPIEAYDVPGTVSIHLRVCWWCSKVRNAQSLIAILAGYQS